MKPIHSCDCENKELVEVMIKISEIITSMREVVKLRFMVTPTFGFIDEDCGLRKWKVKK
jgi:hypothetical protein